ncbi:MAG: bifunctional 5,10-methylenetetrahydrofolate dehydrogenase/5,10-methenyltetrahydrofolate cyclohydrolase [Holosporales bacterium]
MIVLDGKTLGAKVRAEVARQAKEFHARTGITPGLAVVLVGEDPASAVYVRTKGKQATEAGFASFTHRLPKNTTQADLLSLVDNLNQDPLVHGILVQLPLPQHINSTTIIERISPAKDVDGFTTVNIGRLQLGLEAFVPCTPQGCMLLLEQALPREKLAGKHAVIVGRSNIVGKPIAALLLQADCTVTIAHSKTKNLKDITRQADILVAAVGRPKIITGDMVESGIVVLDVGINRVGDSLVGDIDYPSVAPKALAITPVPGGVGPMTIACLLGNTLKAAKETV